MLEAPSNRVKRPATASRKFDGGERAAHTAIRATRGNPQAVEFSEQDGGVFSGHFRRRDPECFDVPPEATGSVLKGLAEGRMRGEIGIIVSDNADVHLFAQAFTSSVRKIHLLDALPDRQVIWGM